MHNKVYLYLYYTREKLHNLNMLNVEVRVITRSDWLTSSEYRFDWLTLFQSIFASQPIRMRENYALES